MKIIVNTDGGARGNPGPAAIGVVIKTENGKNLQTISRKIGETTNNVAEYTAVIAGLTWISQNLSLIKNESNDTDAQLKILFYLDSNLVVNQLNGMFKVKQNNLKNLLISVRILESQISHPIFYSYIPREKNTDADYLVNKAFLI
jgi:ribonuclease HI